MQPFTILLVSTLLLAADGYLNRARADDETRHRGLRALRVDRAATPVIDGVPDEAAWQRAPAYDGFHKHQPRDNQPTPAGLRTEVKLVDDGDALVFAIRAWDDAPANLRGTLTRRDKVNTDQDFIGIWIDPVGHGRNAQFVRVNTAGVVSDGIHRADDDESDLGPDFPIEAAVKILPDGYSMEVRWPLASLRFPYADGRNWRVMVERSVPHADGLLLVSAPLQTDALNHLAFLHEIEGMNATVESVRDRRFVDLRPELTVRTDRVTEPGQRRRGHQAEAGLEVNVRPRADWVFNATLNPDYSQVEVDEPVSQGAASIALSLPEKRGFFLESSDVLGLPLPAFYSRTVADPAWGMRVTWRAAQADATAMSLDDEPGGLVLRGRPFETLEYVNAARTRASLWRGRWHADGLLVGAFASQRDYHADGSNDVVGVDGQWRNSNENGSNGGAQRQAAFVLMHSRTTAGFGADDAAQRMPASAGTYAWGKYIHSSATWWNEAELERISSRFVNDNGFVPQASVVKAKLELNRILDDALVPPGLYQFEAHLGVHETRTTSDHVAGNPGGEVVERKVRPGFWFSAGRRTEFWTQLGFDRQRARHGGRLHDTRALHFGVESSPLPWIAKVAGEFTLGRQLDTAADRVGPGGNVTVDVALRFPLQRGWAVELDHHWNRAWVQGTLGQSAFTDNAWRWLAMLHFTPRDSLRLLAQNTWGARRDDGVTQLAAWNDRQIHRSLLYRHLWRHGRSTSLGYTDDKSPFTGDRAKALTFKLQWEV